MEISNIMLGVFLQFLLMLSVACLQTFFNIKTIGLNQKWKGLRLVFTILLAAVITTALQLAITNIGLSWMGVFVLGTLFLHTVFFMGGMLIERLLFGFANIAMFMFSALFSKIIFFSKLQLLRSDESWQMSLLFVALICIIYTILVLIITRLSTEGKRYMPRKYWIGLNLCFSIISISFYAVDYVNVWMRGNEKLYLYLAIFLLAFTIIWLLLYFVFYFVCRYFTKANEADVLFIQNDMIERYMLKKQASDERIQVLSHDLKHSLTQWRALAEEKGDSFMLQSILEYESELFSSILIDVENENANAVINQKCWEAGQQRVEFLTDGVFHKDLLINRLDLCSLLGNLLDNAIEAAMQAELEALRRVKLLIRRKGNLLILVVENGYSIEPVLENGVFVTHKKDKGLHAVGMKSIQYVAGKYDGVVHNSFENNWFKASIMLRGYSAALSDEN